MVWYCSEWRFGGQRTSPLTMKSSSPSLFVATCFLCARARVIDVGLLSNIAFSFSHSLTADRYMSLAGETGVVDYTLKGGTDSLGVGLLLAGSRRVIAAAAGMF